MFDAFDTHYLFYTVLFSLLYKCDIFIVFSVLAVVAAAPECSITKDCVSHYYDGVCLIIKLETLQMQLLPGLQCFQFLDAVNIFFFFTMIK